MIDRSELLKLVIERLKQEGDLKWDCMSFELCDILKCSETSKKLYQLGIVKICTSLEIIQDKKRTMIRVYDKDNNVILSMILKRILVELVEKDPKYNKIVHHKKFGEPRNAVIIEARKCRPTFRRDICLATYAYVVESVIFNN